MKIVHVYDGHEKIYDGRGSVPGVLWNVARETAASGHDVTVIERQWDGLPVRATHSGVDFRRLDLRTGADEPWTRVPYEQVDSPRSLARLVGDRTNFAMHALRELRRVSFDALHVHLPFAANIILTVAPWLRNRTVYTAHLGELRLNALQSGTGTAAKVELEEDDVRGASTGDAPTTSDSVGGDDVAAGNDIDAPGIVRWFSPDVFLAKRAAHTTVLNPDILQTFVDRGVQSDSISVVPNGVEFDRFADVSSGEIERVREAYGLGHARVALFVGAVMPRKGVTDLVAAFDNVADAVEGDTRLVIAGETGLDEVYTRRVRDEISERSLDDRVDLAGFVPAEDLPALYAAADVCVIPSYEEGFGMTAIEAMAAGTPVVATRVGGLPWILNGDHAGILVDVGDVASMATAITTVFKNSDTGTRMSRQTVARAREYSWEEITSQFTDRYDEIINE